MVLRCVMMKQQSPSRLVGSTWTRTTPAGWEELPLADVGLAPRTAPAYILRIRRRVRTEKDFNYFM